ncbi:MAG: winged helix-turn-helix transcriptional regulator [Candidatus Thorarchaeota archaeon]
MDLIDKGILSDLTKNCRITYQEMSGKYGISANAIRKRILKLEESGVIYRYGTTLSPAMINADHVFGVLYTDGSHDEREFVERIGQNQHINAASSYTGGIYLLIAEFTSMDELHQVSTYLRSFEGVYKVELHTLVIDKGSQVQLGRLALRVLDHLNENPRMPIVELAEKTGLTARMIPGLTTTGCCLGSIRHFNCPCGRSSSLHLSRLSFVSSLRETSPRWKPSQGRFGGVTTSRMSESWSAYITSTSLL